MLRPGDLAHPKRSCGVFADVLDLAPVGKIVAILDPDHSIFEPCLCLVLAVDPWRPGKNRTSGGVALVMVNGVYGWVYVVNLEKLT